MKKITIIENAHIDGYKGDFLRAVDAQGNELATGLWDAWYEAVATDEDGSEYRIFWEVLEDFDLESGDESDACDWASPWMILDEDNKNVTDSCEIVW